jgi:hypothetical protein
MDGFGVIGGRLIGIDHGSAPEGGRRAGAALVQRGRRRREGRLANSDDRRWRRSPNRVQEAELRVCERERLFVAMGEDPDFMPERVDG